MYLEVGEVADARPHLLVRGAEVAEHAEQLVDLAVAGEERAAIDHLSEDAADGPDVDGSGVVFRAEEDFGSAIPQRHDLRRASERGDVRQVNFADVC